MDESRFRHLLNAAQAFGGEYGQGYQIGLRSLFYGDRFQLPAPIETLSDVNVHGDRALGFMDGRGGRNPVPPEIMGVLHFDVPQRQKAAWVRASQRAGMKLVPWVMQTLDAASAENSNG